MAEEDEGPRRRHYRRTNFDGQDLSGEDLSGFDLAGSSFRGTKLVRATLNHCDLDGVDLSNADLTGASMIHCDLLDSRLDGAVLRDATLEYASLMSASLVGCDLKGANLNYAFLGGADLTGAVLNDCWLTSTNLCHTKLEGTSLGSSFQGTILCDVDLASAIGWTRAHFLTACHVDFQTVRRTVASLGSVSSENATRIQRFFAEAGVPEWLLRSEAWPVEVVDRFPQAVRASDVRPDAQLHDPLRKYRVLDGEPITVARAQLAVLLDSQPPESELQSFLAKHPGLLMHRLGGGGHGRWSMPQLRLGSEYVADFVLGFKDSLGYHWRLVELEGCNERLFVADGDPAKMLRHAIRQIQDWRSWLQQNVAYAQREEADGGLGLRDISGESDGLIIIGRRSTLTDDSRMLRRRMSQETNIRIHTYDWLLSD